MKITASAAGILVAAGLFLAAPGARAAASFEFLFSSGSVQDDDQFLLHLAVGSYGYPRREIEPVLPRMRNVEEDLPVVLFLAAQSGRSVEFIVNLRSGGLSWSAVFSEVGVSCEPLFAGIDRDPGPPYGKAWGYWKKHPRDLALSDRDIEGLVGVQTARRVTDLSAYDLARAQGQGRSVASVVAEKKGRSGAKGAAESAHGPSTGPGAAKGNGKAGKAAHGGGHGKGK